jgi:NAD-dependent DNA ligase
MTQSINKYIPDFITKLEKLSELTSKIGENFKSSAYQKAIVSLKSIDKEITDINQLKTYPNIGKTIIEKFQEFIETGEISAIKKYMQDPIIVFTNIYGIGPKNAKQLVDKGIVTIEQLKQPENEKLLNDKQKLGLKYSDDILERIPRDEIQKYSLKLQEYFLKAIKETNDIEENNYFEIVGSYRRQAKSSGDIDIIITNRKNEKKVFNKFLDILIRDKILIEILSRGLTKSLTIAKLSSGDIARRLDFLYSPPDEYAFSILYFTGSKDFNTAMRLYSLKQDLTLSEHGFHKFDNKSKKKLEKIQDIFLTEKDIFDYLNLVYKEPIDRIDENSIQIKSQQQQEPQQEEQQEEQQQEEQQQEQPQSQQKQATKTHKIKTPTLSSSKTLKKLDKLENKDTLKNIENFKNHGISVLDSLGKKELTNILKLVNQQYYSEDNINQNTELLTDNQYDILRDYVIKKYPTNKIAKEQHKTIKIERQPVKLPYSLMSMDKIKPDTKTLEKYKTKYNGPYVISDKLDGISALYSTENGKQKMYTRGNGFIGQSIDHLIEYFTLPKQENITIRGEIIIKKDTFLEKYSKQYANSRNFVAGIVNNKKITEQFIGAIKDIDFVIYELINPPNLKPSQQFEYLSKITPRLNIVINKTVDQEDLTNEFLSKTLLERRETSLYTIDGIIVNDDNIYPRQDKNPEHAFAFKMVLSEQEAESQVVDIIWTASKDGLLKPRIKINPVVIGGTQINYATGFNAKFIVDNNIGLGTVVKIIRSGDVIPYIKSVTTPADKPLMPKQEYKWNATHVDIILTDIDSDPTVEIKKITKFFKTIEVEGLGEANIKRIIDSGLKTIPDILRATTDDFMKVENFKIKMATKIYNSIHEKIDNIRLPQLAAATNIFGRGLGEKVITNILSSHPDILIKQESLEDKINKIKKINGMGEKTSQQFTENIPLFIEFLEESNMKTILEKPLSKKSSKQQDKPSQKLNDKFIIISGFRDKEFTKQLEDLGAKIETTITKKTNLLIIKNKETISGKVAEAEKKNIKIMTRDEFEKTIN